MNYKYNRTHGKFMMGLAESKLSVKRDVISSKEKKRGVTWDSVNGSLDVGRRSRG